MPALPISLACWNYDRTRALIDGSVRPDGISLRTEVMRPRIAFERMLAGEFDVSEMSFSTYISMKGRNEDGLVAIPVMLSKMFRHDCIYVRRDAGITAPQQLAGLRVGTMRFNSTAIVFAKALLQHDYGVNARDIEWFLGGVNHGMDVKRPSDAPAEVRIRSIAKDRTLDGMLLDRELDALITQDIPRSFFDRPDEVTRLIADFKSAEIAYFKRTKIFPIMHIVAIRASVYRANPWIARSLYDAFSLAKDGALKALYDTDALHLSLPFLIDHLDEAIQTFGTDFYAYGVEPNRASIAALCRYLFEQGLSPRLVDVDELFADVN